MTDQKKKVYFLSGSVLSPLKVGARSFIFQNSKTIRTAEVAVIHQISEDLIVFETRDHTYCVAPKQSLANAAMNVPAAICA